MNKYLVQYSIDGVWVAFTMLDDSIYAALDWVHDNIQRVGVCISLDDGHPTPELVQREETFAEWSTRRQEEIMRAYIFRQRRTA
jgi:hypothetical protein